MSYGDYPRTRQDAVKENSVHYFTGKPCKYNHVCFRYTCDSKCSECQKIKSKKWVNSRVKTCPIYSQSKLIQRAMRYFIRKGYWSKWLTGCGYTPETLRGHFEGLFAGEMTWETFGTTWTIDHRKPITKCESLDEVWALSNLQPLSMQDNLKKCNKLEEL